MNDKAVRIAVRIPKYEDADREKDDHWMQQAVDAMGGLSARGNWSQEELNQLKTFVTTLEGHMVAPERMGEVTEEPLEMMQEDLDMRNARG